MIIKLRFKDLTYLYHEGIDQCIIENYIFNFITQQPVVLKWLHFGERIVLRSSQDF